MSLIAVLSLFGCTGLKNISSVDPLFVGHHVKFSNGSPENYAAIADLKSVLVPAPNYKILWMRPSLSLGNMLSDTAKSKKFWKNKSSEPVTLSQVKPDQIRRAMNNRLFQNGYFNSVISLDTILIGEKRAKYEYTVTINEPHRLGEIQYPEPTSELNTMILKASQDSQLHTGDIYSLESIKDERIRINDYLEENGYIYFNPEFLLFQADTVSEKNRINLRISIKPDTPTESRTSYTIGKVYIHDDFGLESLSPDTLDFNPYFLITNHHDLEFDALKRGLFLESGNLYAKEDHIQSIRYFGSLPIIRNASIKFSEGESENVLNPNVYLTQRKRFAYTAEVNTIFRSTNYFGPGVIFTYTDRNVNRGAEQFKVNLRGRFEVQIAEGVVNPAYELGLDVNYTLPRLFPEFLNDWGKRDLPRSNISVGYNLFKRLDLYRLNSLYTDIGYKWNRNDKISQSLNPIQIVFTKIPEDSKSEGFRNYLNENPGVERSFKEQLVLGTGYTFSFDPELKGQSQFYFQGGIDMAGNLLNLIYNAGNAKTDSSGRYTLFGIPYSQYVRLQSDFRYSFRFNKNTSLASRFVAGVGIPYGNSNIIPYIRQFYIGGTNSLRSFLARSVGPGSEVPPEGFNDLTGDIHLELNLEYRFTIARRFKGALFMDAGNIWLYNEDPSRPDGNFQFQTFMNEVAISSGWGLRWDFDYIIARVDFAYKLRIPYLPEGERWARNINLLKPVINIAIGYPF